MLKPTAKGVSMKGPEKRREYRHRGKLPVELESGGSGITQDFNGSGVFFETDRSFTPGQPIEFTLILKHIDPEHPIHLKCQGKVVRVEERGEMIGVATSVVSYAFGPFQEYMRK
jgi:hypothetical protein